MIEVECGASPVYYKEEMFQRDGANCKKVTGSAQADIFKLFS